MVNACYVTISRTEPNLGADVSAEPACDQIGDAGLKPSQIIAKDVACATAPSRKLADQLVIVIEYQLVSPDILATALATAIGWTRRAILFKRRRHMAVLVRRMSASTIAHLHCLFGHKSSRDGAGWCDPGSNAARRFRPLTPFLRCERENAVLSDRSPSGARLIALAHGQCRVLRFVLAFARVLGLAIEQ